MVRYLVIEVADSIILLCDCGLFINFAIQND